MSPARPSEPGWVRRTLIGVAAIFVVLLVALPMATVLASALAPGLGAFVRAILTPDAIAALSLSALTVACVLPINLLFGVAMAWALGRYRFRGRSVLIALLDLPLSVSPVIAGMSLILLFGSKGLLGPLLDHLERDVVFAPPGVVIATLFVTFPFVARELIPFWETQGADQEEAALILGASPWQMFWRVSLPNARYALLYGAILTGARSLGEFGAVSVVSGHIRGQTNTLPLHVEVLYGDYRFADAFAVAALLMGSGLVTLVVKRRLAAHLEASSADR